MADARRCASSSCHLTMNRSLLQGPPVPLPRLFTAVGHSAASTPNTEGERSLDPSVARNSVRSSTTHLCQVLNCPPGLGFSPPAIVPNTTRLENRSLCLPRHGLCKKEPPFTDGRFDALATCHLEDLRVRENGMVSAKTALEATRKRTCVVVSR